MWLNCNVCSLPHCCGFYEAGEFSETVGKTTWHDFYEETPDGLVKKILRHAEGRPVIFNFVKLCQEDNDGDSIPGEYEDEYRCDVLREYVKSFPKVIDLGKHINPGTHNKIHSLIIKDYNE